jgi:hypothetical protein
MDTKTKAWTYPSTIYTVPSLGVFFSIHIIVSQPFEPFNERLKIPVQ